MMLSQLQWLFLINLRFRRPNIKDKQHGDRVLDKVKVKFGLEQAMEAQRGSRGVALFFL
jgi:hypothetical protein